VLNSTLLEAAIGPRDGSVGFKSGPFSNLGKISQNAPPVAMIAVETALEKCGSSRIGLVKIDIEGGEQLLFDGPLGWLDRIDAIIIEFHPPRENCEKIIKIVSAHGFQHIPSNSAFPENMDCFARIERPAEYSSPRTDMTDERS
jgi:hypothetical protein